MDESDDYILKTLDEIDDFLQNKSRFSEISTDDQKQSLQSLYLSEHLADIHFKVGTNGERIPAHRLMFYLNKCGKIDDIYDHNHSNDNNDGHIELPIEQTDSRNFKLFLSYLYYNSIDLTEDDVPNIISLCDLFECESLRKICINFKLKCFKEKTKNEFKQILTYALPNKSKITRNQSMPSNSTQISTKTPIQNISNKRMFVNNFEPVVHSNTNDLNVCKKVRFNDTNDTTNSVAINIQCGNDSNQCSNEQLNNSSKSDNNEDISKDCGDVSIDYRVISQHRCHNKNELKVSVWRSVFMPIEEYEPKSIVTCGGYTSSLIELSNNNDKSNVIKTINKIETETLFSLSCTVLSSDDNTSLISGKHVVLALGGEKCIYFAYNHKIYRKMNAHREAVYALLFHTNKPLWLFSASSDRNIKIWDIGKLSSERAKFEETKLLFAITTRFPIISISFSLKYDMLIASGESSEVMFLKNITSLKPLEAKACIGDGITTISGLSFACDSKYIAIRPSKSDQILITNFSAINEIIVSHSKNKSRDSLLEINFVKFASLKYSVPLDDRSFIYMCERSGMLACGDDRGRVFLYDIRTIKCGDLLEPSKILELPVDRSGDTAPPIMLSVDISHDLKYITASTNNNLICIWKQFQRK